MSTTQTFSLMTPDGTREIQGKLLGYSSSNSDIHSHALGEHAPPGMKCSACRWFEARIIRTDGEDAKYAVHTMGRSKVPGEIQKCRLVLTDSPREVIEVLTVRKSGTTGSFIPKPSTRAIAQAADLDDGLYDAYLDLRPAA